MALLQRIPNTRRVQTFLRVFVNFCVVCWGGAALTLTHQAVWVKGRMPLPSPTKVCLDICCRCVIVLIACVLFCSDF